MFELKHPPMERYTIHTNDYDNDIGTAYYQLTDTEFVKVVVYDDLHCPPHIEILTPQQFECEVGDTDLPCRICQQDEFVHTYCKGCWEHFENADRRF